MTLKLNVNAGRLYDEYGIILNVSNNKRRSLLKSEIILNIDFPEELVNNYRIYEKAIIINISDKVDIKSKRFNGINVNKYNIIIPEECKLKAFQDEIIYESLIYIKNGYKEIKEKIIDDNIEIEALIGNNGKINIDEIAKFNTFT